MAHNLIFIFVYFWIVLGAILLFMAPFYALYRYKHYRSRQPKVGFNQHLEYFFASKEADYLIFFWALSEAVFWFVIPEFLLLLIIFMRVRKRFDMLIYDIAGTVVGTCIALAMHLSNQSLVHLPYIKQGMIDQTYQWFHDFGIFGLLYQPFSGVPYKVFTHTFQGTALAIIGFIIFAIIVRLARYVIAYAILSRLYPFFHKYVYRNYIPLFLIAVFLFSVMLLKISNKYGEGYQVTTRAITINK